MAALAATGRLLPAIQLRPICSPRPQLDAPGPRPQRRACRVDPMGEMCAGFHAVPETSCSPSWATAASTCLLTAATSACASSNWVARCHWGRSFRFFEKPSIYLRTSNIVRSVPPSLMRMGRVSFLDRYECAIDCSPYHRLCSLTTNRRRLTNNIFASSCDNRRPIIACGTCHLRSSSWASVKSP